MKVGDYVRTKDGKLAKIVKIDFDDEEQKDICIFDKEIILYYEYTADNCYKEEVDIYIIKSSPNIIDLIEVGDYVNEEYVTYINKKDNYVDVGYDDLMLRAKDIKSIVTKEQFEAMEYKILKGEDKGGE